MPDSFDPTEDALRKARRLLNTVVVIIIAVAILIVFFVKRLPLPARLLLASFDIVIAATLWLVMRQKMKR